MGHAAALVERVLRIMDTPSREASNKPKQNQAPATRLKPDHGVFLLRAERDLTFSIPRGSIQINFPFNWAQFIIAEC